MISGTVAGNLTRDPEIKAGNNGNFTTFWHFMTMFGGIAAATVISLLIFKKYEKTVAELI